MDKVNYPENTLFYVNQIYLMVRKGKNILFADHFILRQLIAAANVPVGVDNYDMDLMRSR